MMEPGTELDHGKYRIVRRIGAGEVYEAEQAHTHKRVAIKSVHRSAEARERLWGEARALARLRHPNVVDVYDAYIEGDALFLVMELLEGETYAEMLSRAYVPLHRRIALLLPAMRAVSHAHKQGLLHRDLKADNIFLARQPDSHKPVPKVLDFGISKLELQDLDERADVHAFGLILYEAMTGRNPDETPRAKQFRAELPSSLDRLIGWAMAKDRARRISSLDQFIRELEPFASERGFRRESTPSHMTVAAAPSVQRTRFSPVLALLLLASLLLLLVIVMVAGRMSACTAD